MDFWQRFSKSVTKGMATTQEIYAKTRDKAQNLSEQAVLKIQVSQLEKQIEKRFLRLGARVYELLEREGRATVSRKTADVASAIDDVRSLEGEIGKCEAKLAKLQA